MLDKKDRWKREGKKKEMETRANCRAAWHHRRNGRRRKGAIARWSRDPFYRGRFRRDFHFSLSLGPKIMGPLRNRVREKYADRLSKMAPPRPIAPRVLHFGRLHCFTISLVMYISVVRAWRASPTRSISLNDSLSSGTEPEWSYALLFIGQLSSVANLNNKKIAGYNKKTRTRKRKE